MDNSDQIAFWNGPGGQQWAKNQETMDENLKPFAEAVLTFAKPAPGERVLDVGCGCGDTTLRLADLVGRDGMAIGLDISGPMIERAKDRVGAYETMGLPAPRFVLEDASTYRPKVPGFDLIFSRFGVMFFAEPAAAFANLRAALRPGGRLAFICWQPMPLNDWFSVPMAAALTVLPAPEAPPPRAPGPFAFGERDYLADILGDAGFENVTIEGCSISMDMGSADDVEGAARQLATSGPLSRLMAEAPDADRPKVITAVADALQSHTRNGRIVLETQTWLVGARNP